MGELRWWPAVRSYPHPESRTENSAVDVSEAVSRGSEQMLVTEGLGDGMVVVVEESSHEQATAIFSSSLSQTTGPPVCLLRMACLDVTCKQASEVWYSGYELTAYIVQARACVAIHCLVASSQCSKPRRESSTQTPPVHSSP